MNIFNKILSKAPTHSTFDLSHDVKLSCKMGEIVPVFCEEALPGDSWNMSNEAMFRMMPMIAPIMHKVDIYFHTFFVPNRIIWGNWENFITGGQPGDPIPALPTIDVGNTVAPSSLANYLGIPIINGSQALPQSFSALPFAAYHRIWFEWYRDQNLQDVSGLACQDGLQNAAQTTEFLKMRQRAWEHDYFTSALPFAQKGAPVEIPIDFANATIQAQKGAQIWRDTVTGNPVVGGAAPVTIEGVDSTGSANYSNSGTGAKLGNNYLDPNGTLELTGTAGTTINDLRSAYSLQRWLEKAARGGSRYIEQIKAHFGVNSSDQRLNRPEYLGGSKASMSISEVLQTSATDQAVSPQANMAGHGISVSAGSGYNYRCEEHGWIMTCLSIRPKTAYYNGVPRHFLKRDKTDWYWPDFANLGEQPIYNGELAWNPDYTPAGENYQTWGYIPRYSEYRYKPSRICGQMADTLEFWHMGRKFDISTGMPALNEDFIVCDPTKRIFAVINPNDDEIVAHIYNKVMARRPLPIYGTPGIF